MAIGSNDAIEKFGTLDTVSAGGGTSAVNDAAMSAAADAAAWTNDDDAPDVVLILKFQKPSGTPDGHIYIHVRPINVDGTDDAYQPDATDRVSQAGVFQVPTGLGNATDVTCVKQISLLPFQCKSSQEYEFYVFNDAGVTMSAGWTLKVRPVTMGPHA